MATLLQDLKMTDEQLRMQDAAIVGTNPRDPRAPADVKKAALDAADAMLKRYDAEAGPSPDQELVAAHDALKATRDRISALVPEPTPAKPPHAPPAQPAQTPPAKKGT